MRNEDMNRNTQLRFCFKKIKKITSFYAYFVFVIIKKEFKNNI